MSNMMNASGLPSAMEQKLRQIRWRQTLLAFLRAMAIAASVLIVAMVAAMAFDWSVTLFNTGVRTGLTVGVLALAALSLVMAGLPPLLEALRITHAASNADDEVPQLEERWTTVTSFANSEHQPSSETGKAMLQQVTSEAVAMGRLVRPTQVATPTVARPAVLMLAACGLLLASFLSINWPQTSVLMRRFWSPATNITATQLKSVTGDVEIPRGESLDLVTSLSGVPQETAILEIATGDEFVDSFELTPDEEQANAFIHQVIADESFHYRVVSGDGQTTWHTVDVIDHPSLSDVRLTITAPEYVDRPEYEKSLIPSRVRVAQGSHLKLMMKPVDVLERLDLALTVENSSDDSEEGPTEALLTLRPDTDGWYRFETQLVEDVVLSPTLLSEHGLNNEERYRCRIQVIPDKAPFARIVSPADEMAVAFDDVIEIPFEAHDDHGIETAELVIYDESATEDGEEQKILDVIPIPLGDQKGEKHVMANAQLDLKKLGVEEGKNISYTIRVTDSRMLEIDPNNMRAQMEEARLNGSKEDSQVAAMTAQEGMKKSQDDAAERDGKSSDPDAEKMKNMLASAGDLTSRQRGIGESPEGDAERRSAAISAEADRVESQGSSEKDGADKKSSDGSAEASQPGPKGDSEESNDSAESNRKAIKTVSSGDSDGEDSPTEANSDSTESDQKNPDGKNSRGDIGETAVAKGESDQKEKPQDDKTGSGNQIAGKEKDGNDPEGSNGGTENDPSERNADNAEEMLAKTNAADAKPVGDDAERQSSGGSGGSGSDGKSKRERTQPSESGAPRKVSVALAPQQSESGQNAETKRRKLKITQRLSAIAAASGRKITATKIRDRVVRIDEMLAEVETALTAVVERNIPDADRGEQFRLLDKQLGDIEKYISDLRNETKEQQFAFVGLQMVHISRTHVTPARDRTYIAIREPLGTDNPTVALHHVVRAREKLEALLKRYDRVARDEELAKRLEESVEMYEVLVERSQQLMREARQNRNPLKRKMAVIKVDQDYLDRYAEVVTMRREMMTEFGRMLGEDPRLLSRYLDTVKRRRQSLRNQLSEIFERQEEVTTELSSWLQVEEDQRVDLWAIIAELRLHAATPLAKEAAALAERVEQAMPLILRTDQTTPALVIEYAQKIARLTREITFDKDKYLQQIAQGEESFDLQTRAEQLTYLFGELDAALDQLNFQNEESAETQEYVTARLLESRTVADQADAWAQLAGQLERRRYSGIAESDQLSIALLTELLRIDMLGMEDELNNQFQQTAATDLPGEIADMIRDLHRVMESITFNQTAATFAAANDRLTVAEVQEIKALDGFEKAEKLFDKIRRAVVKALDEYDVDDPNIADLRDPTLDEFLARLEREPGIEAQLGIPNRPRNLRVLTQAMTGQQSNGGDLLSDARQAARQRARKAMQMVDMADGGSKRGKKDEPEKPESEMTEEERQEREAARQMQEMLEKSLASIKEKMKDPQTDDDQRRRLEEMAANMERLIKQPDQTSDSTGTWERIVESEKAKEMLKTLSSGQKVPDSQWNKLLSTLDDGIWQVGGRTPPEDYRKAIERYQERLRQLMNTVGSGAE